MMKMIIQSKVRKLLKPLKEILIKMKKEEPQLLLNEKSLVD